MVSGLISGEKLYWKMFDIGSTVLKLWLLKDIKLPPSKNSTSYIVYL